MTTRYLPDYSIPAPDGHVWARPVTDCPDCPCCTLALCRRATTERSDCWTQGGGNSPGQYRLDTCPCAPMGESV